VIEEPRAVKRLWDGVVRDPGPVKVTSFADGATLDVPGQPRILHLPGRIRGRCALHLSDASVLFSGDVLVTDDPSTRRSGPRLLVKVNQDDWQARAPLDELASVHARLLSPGLEAPWGDGVAAAVTEARRGGLHRWTRRK
jgi:glyoxylase-like metal-dependent hydrolase (beta-lactamase superfamily II)